MPVYAYKCGDCGTTYDRLRSIAAEDNEVDCPVCGKVGQAKRLLSTFAAFSKSDGISRPANSSTAGGGNGGGSCCGGACGCQH
jgi:putative FmdB family regulatory protein